MAYRGMSLLFIGILESTFRAGRTMQAPGPMPTDFTSKVKYRSWLNKDILSCTLARCSRGDDQGNLLYANCRTPDINLTKFFDSVKNVLLTENGKTGEFKIVKGIPKDEKEDPHFPLGFRTDNNHEVFQLAYFDFLRLTETENESARGSSVGAKDQEVDVNVSVKGQTYKCKMNVVHTNKTAISPYCDGQTQTRTPCKIIPKDIKLRCGANRTVNYTLMDYKESCNSEIMDPYLKKLEMENMPLEIVPSTVFGPALATTAGLLPVFGPVPPAAAGLSAATIALIAVAIIAVAVIAILLGLFWFMKRRHQKGAKGMTPSSSGAYYVKGQKSPTTSSDYSGASGTVTSKAPHIGDAENGTVVRPGPMPLSCDQDDIGSSFGDTETRANSQKKCLLMPEHRKTRQHPDDQLPSDLCAENNGNGAGGQSQPITESPGNTARTYSPRGPETGRALLGNNSYPVKKVERSEPKLLKDLDAERRLGQRTHKVPKRKHAMDYKEQDFSPTDTGSAHKPLLYEERMDTSHQRDIGTGHVGPPLQQPAKKAGYRQTARETHC